MRCSFVNNFVVVVDVDENSICLHIVECLFICVDGKLILTLSKRNEN